MSIEVKVPQLPESVADAVLGAWHKAEGDSVTQDENLVDLETDKVVLEVPAPRSGILKTIKVQDGATVSAGDVLGIVEEADTAAPGGGGEAPANGQAAAAQPAADRGAAPEKETAERAGGDKLSPAVRRLVEQHQLDPADIRGSGKDGRLIKGDVMAYLERDRQPGGAAPATAVEARPPVAGAGRQERRVPMTRLRKRIAERLVEAQQNAAMLTTFNEVDLTQVMELRARYKDRFEKDHGVKLGFMSFFVKASIEALQRLPVVNASVDGDDILYHDNYDIGIAVSTDRGLLVPVLKNADALSFAEVEKAIADFGQRARKGQITMEELAGGTFTITNGGVFGSLLSTPILNPPQSGILGMHKIQQRPMVVDGQVVPRPVMYIALTYDHRIIDGRDAVQFLVSIKESLEDPARMLLQV